MRKITVWMYAEFDNDGVLVKMIPYGSFTKLAESEEIYIKGFKLPESALRKLLKENDDRFQNGFYHIEKTTLHTKPKSK